VEKTPYIEARKSDLTPLMQFSPLAFHKCKGYKKRDFYISPSYSCHQKSLKFCLPSAGGYSCVVPQSPLLGCWKPPTASGHQPSLESYVGQSARYAILAERAETQVPNIERALFIFKKATPL